MTMGAVTAPVRTRSLKTRPILARSPYPSQQMRAGSPCDVTRSRASVIQRARAWSSGNVRSTASSVAARSAGSPDRTAHRNGPLPSQKSGRMYAGTKPGKPNASSTPAFCASARMLFP